jgi:hypothetical protein
MDLCLINPIWSTSMSLMICSYNLEVRILVRILMGKF